VFGAVGLARLLGLLQLAACRPTPPFSRRLALALADPSPPHFSFDLAHERPACWSSTAPPSALTLRALRTSAPLACCRPHRFRPGLQSSARRELFWFSPSSPLKSSPASQRARRSLSPGPVSVDDRLFRRSPRTHHAIQSLVHLETLTRARRRLLDSNATPSARLVPQQAIALGSIASNCTTCSLTSSLSALPAQARSHPLSPSPSVATSCQARPATTLHLVQSSCPSTSTSEKNITWTKLSSAGGPAASGPASTLAQRAGEAAWSTLQFRRPPRKGLLFH
jgi:hypothetical protein